MNFCNHNYQMNAYYQFEIFIIDDNSDESKRCKEKMTALNNYGHYFKAYDVTAAKKHYRDTFIKEFTEKPSDSSGKIQTEFPFVFCEGGIHLPTRTMDGFLEMLTMSPCYSEIDHENDVLTLKKKE